MAAACALWLREGGDRSAAAVLGRWLLLRLRLIATALGVGLSVLLGIALMTLVFLSSRMGQDANAADHSLKDEHDPRL